MSRTVTKKAQSTKHDVKTVCGIIMPISHTDDDHTEAHWQEVKEVISQAIIKAECRPQPVWEGGSHDIIQSKILQNIFENEIVVCDISTRNPNVMLEMGMRLTTKKPTLLIAEKGTKLPFDTSIIHTEFYDPKLQFSSSTKFIDLLSQKIIDVLRDVGTGKYKPYMESFEFETVEPTKVTVSSEERLAELIGEMGNIVRQAKARDVFATEMAPQLKADAWKRAMDEVSVTSRSEKAKQYGTAINDLLGDYTKSINRIEVGDTVIHKAFGVGQVVDTDGEKISVKFDIGVRRVLSAFLENI